HQGRALSQVSGNRNMWRILLAALGYAYALQGRHSEGRALLEKAISEGISTGMMVNYASQVAWLSEVCRLAGRGEEAWQHTCQALDLARRNKKRANRGPGLHTLGPVCAPPD